MKKDQDIKDIFERLKEQDGTEIDIPKFEMPAGKSNRFVFHKTTVFTAAASILLLVGLMMYFEWPVTKESPEDDILLTVTFSLGEEEETDYISEETSISDWESPSDILIQEFEDDTNF